jgi:hypothetical protein
MTAPLHPTQNSPNRLNYASPTERPSKAKQTLRRIAHWIIGTFIILVLIALFIPSHHPGRRNVNQVKCASNLRQLGQALLIYTNNHQSKFPSSFNDLFLADHPNSELFVCPASPDDRATGPTTQALEADFASPGHLSYLYCAAGLTTAVPPNTVLAYEPLINHQDEGADIAGSHFLLATGRVLFLKTPDATRAIADLKSGTNPPAPIK